MPIYEYRCPSCGDGVECLQRADAPPPDCRPCGVAMERVLSVTGPPVVSTATVRENVPCCGNAGGCDQPKRCCGG